MKTCAMMKADHDRRMSEALSGWLTWKEIGARFPDRWVCLEVSTGASTAYPFEKARVLADLDAEYHLCESGHEHFYTREAPAAVMGRDQQAWMVKKHSVHNPLALQMLKEDAARRHAGVRRDRGWGVTTIVVGLDGERGTDGHRRTGRR